MMSLARAQLSAFRPSRACRCITIVLLFRRVYMKASVFSGCQEGISSASQSIPRQHMPSVDFHLLSLCVPPISFVGLRRGSILWHQASSMKSPASSTRQVFNPIRWHAQALHTIHRGRYHPGLLSLHLSECLFIRRLSHELPALESWQWDNRSACLATGLAISFIISTKSIELLSQCI